MFDQHIHRMRVHKILEEFRHIRIRQNHQVMIWGYMMLVHSEQYYCLHNSISSYFI